MATIKRINDDRIEVNSKHRNVILEVGREYIIDQLNPKTQKNRGRRCVFLGVVTVDNGKYQKAKVRYLDNNRVGRAEFTDLAYVDKNTGYVLDLDFTEKNQATWGIRDKNKEEYKRLWSKLLKRPERDMDLIMLGYCLAMIDFAEFPAANWAGETITKEEVKILISSFANKIRTPSNE